MTALPPELRPRRDAIHDRVIRRGTVRRRRRHVATATVALLLVAIPVGAVSLAVTRGGGVRRVEAIEPSTRAVAATTTGDRAGPTTRRSAPLAFDVPWIAAPYPQFVPLAPVPTTQPPANARPCTAGDVSIRADGGNGAGGVLEVLYAVKNVSASTCLLGGYPPSLVLTQPGRPPVAAHDGSAFPFADPGPAANVAPGLSGFLSLATGHSCPEGQLPPRSSQMYHHAVVTLPGGGQATLTGDFDLVCGILTSRFGVSEPQPTYPAEWYAGLSASVAVPDRVDAGSTLLYVVTLRNPSAHPIRIDPCPGYIEHLFGAQLNAVTGHGLNCDKVQQIPARGRVRYEMLLPVPGDAPPGTATIEWMLAGPSAPQVRTTLNVRGRDEK